MILKVFNQYLSSRKVAFFFGESIFIFAMVMVGTYLRFFWDTDFFPPAHRLLIKGILIAASVQLSLYYFDLYNFKVFQSNLELAIRLLQSLGASSMMLGALYYFFPSFIIGRGIFLISVILVGAAIVGWRMLYNHVSRTNDSDQRVMLVGLGPLARSIAQEIAEQGDTGFRIIGFIGDDSAGVPEKLVNATILGDCSQINRIVQRERVDRIVVALEERRGKFPEAQLLECKLKGVSVEEGIEFYEHLTGRLQVESLRPSFLIFSNGFKKSKLAVWVKRSTGFGISLCGLILSSPLLLAIAVLIKIDSRGPIFYRQKRVGQDGKVFDVLKFRSMVQDAESGGPVWAQQEDNRVTRVGRWIRKWRFDEIPQMLNVLRGDMAFVGPRPERPFFVEQLRKEIPYYNQRLSVKPGLTGWAQIKYPYGASTEDAQEKLKYDLYYIKNMSAALDLLILFETIKVVLFRRGSR